MGVINKVVVKGVTYDIEDKINKEELLKRLQGTSENSNAMRDPFKFAGSYITATLGDLREWLDSLHGTDSTLDNRGVYRAILNGSVIDIVSSPIDYATERYLQVVRGRVSLDSKGLLTFSDEYHIFERQYTSTDGWSAWRVAAGANTIENLSSSIENLNSSIENLNSSIENLSKNAVQYDSFEVEAQEDTVEVQYNSIEGEDANSFAIPSATDTTAGVMSAEDKVALNEIPNTIAKEKNAIINGDTIAGLAREVYSRTGKVDTATFLKRSTAGSTSISDGVASIKQIGGNIVKNMASLADYKIYNSTVETGAVYKVTRVGANMGVIYDSVKLFAGNVYYTAYILKSVPGLYLLHIGDYNARFQKTTDGWEILSGRVVYGGTGGRYLLVASRDTNVNEFYVKQAITINLTEMFGPGNEPTKEECDRMFGTMDALPQGLNIAQLTGLRSTGFNQWNPANVLNNKSIVENAIEDDVADRHIAVIECLPCKTGAGENNGYVIGYGEGDSWSDTDIQVYVSPLNPMETTGELYLAELAKDATYNTYVPQISGYLVVVTPTTEKFCAHLHWSGDRLATDYEEYIESDVTLPTISQMSEWGLAGFYTKNGKLQDTINLENNKYTKRIGCVDMGTLTWSYDSESNYFTATINGMYASSATSAVCHGYITEQADATALNDKHLMTDTSTVYLKDSSYTTASALKTSLQGVMLYYELATPEEYPIVTKAAPNYIGSDYGVEKFVGSEVPLAANILFYMRSLVSETRNFLDRLMAGLGTSDVTTAADKIIAAVNSHNEVEEVIEETTE